MTLTLDQLERKVRRIERDAATREEVSELCETLDILSDRDALDRLEQSDRDMAEGRTESFESSAEALRD